MVHCNLIDTEKKAIKVVKSERGISTKKPRQVASFFKIGGPDSSKNLDKSENPKRGWGAGRGGVGGGGGSIRYLLL